MRCQGHEARSSYLQRRTRAALGNLTAVRKSVSEKLFQFFDFGFSQIEISFCRLHILILQRLLSFRHVDLQRFLGGGDVAAQAEAVRALLAAEIVQTVIDRAAPAGELINFLLQLFELFRFGRLCALGA